MPFSKCSCNNPCTCYFEYDGDRPNTDYTLPYQYGRYSTRKTGSGTAANPFIIEFLDSQEFQVEAGQLRTSSDQVLASNTSASQLGNLNTVDYETPTEIFMAYTLHAVDGIVFPSAHKFWYATAEATFVNNGSAVGTRRIHLQWHPPVGDPDNEFVPYYGGMYNMILAGNTSSGLPAGSEDITLSCSGLIPFINYTSNINFWGPAGSIAIFIQQDTGSSMLVRNAKITLVAI